jgi:hypothetical protein
LSSAVVVVEIYNKIPFDLLPQHWKSETIINKKAGKKITLHHRKNQSLDELL